MAEPTSSTATVAVTVAAIAGMLTALGIGPAPLFWAFVGATIGMSMAPKVAALRAVVIYLCSVLASALLGAASVLLLPLDAPLSPAGARLAANACACLLGLLFHPLLSAATNAVPVIVNGVLRRIGLGGA